MSKTVHMTVVDFTIALLSKIFFPQTWHVESLTAGTSVFPHIFACSVAEIASKAGSLLTGDFYNWIKSSKSLHLLRNVSVEGLIAHLILKSQKMLMTNWNMNFLGNLKSQYLFLFMLFYFCNNLEYLNF